jgi:hypothetical protein
VWYRVSGDPDYAALHPGYRGYNKSFLMQQNFVRPGNLVCLYAQKSIQRFSYVKQLYIATLLEPAAGVIIALQTITWFSSAFSAPWRESIIFSFSVNTFPAARVTSPV